METFKIRTRKWGQSIGMVIPKIYAEENNIQVGDIVEVVASKIKTDKEIRSYRCRLCEHQFDTDENIPYCPICDSTDGVEAFKDE